MIKKIQNHDTLVEKSKTHTISNMGGKLLSNIKQ